MREWLKVQWHNPFAVTPIALVVVIAAVLAIVTLTDDPAGELPVTTIDPHKVAAQLEAELRAEIARLEAEIDKANVDQLDLRRTVTTIAQRASRSSRTPRSTPTGTVRASGGSCGQWRSLIAAHFPADQVDRACRIMMCESGGNPNARNPRSSATGLFQILRGSTDPVANVTQAAAMYRKSGWRPWVCKG